MTPIDVQARRLEADYRALAQLFDQFCQQAGALADHYHFFNWPDYEDTPPQSRAFSLLGEGRELRLRCQSGQEGALRGLLQIVDEEGRIHTSLGFHADGQLTEAAGHLLDNPPELLLRLLIASIEQAG